MAKRYAIYNPNVGFVSTNGQPLLESEKDARAKAEAVTGQYGGKTTLLVEHETCERTSPPIAWAPTT